MRETLYYRFRKPQRITGVEDDRADIEDINFNSDQLDSVLHTQANRMGTIENGLDKLDGKIDAEAASRANGDAQNAQAIRDETARAQSAESGKLGRTETAADSALLGGLPPSEYATAAQGAKAETALQTETDPTVPDWAKQATKPAYTAEEVGAATTGDVTAAVASAKAYTDTEIANNPGPPGATGRDGAPGTAFWALPSNANMTNISQIAGMKVGDYVINTWSSTRTILGVSTASGGIVKSTSATTGTASGNIRGATGATGAAASVPSGMIMRCKGNSIPSGWVLCDGKNGTVNLSQLFIIYETISGSTRTPHYGVVYVQKT